MAKRVLPTKLEAEKTRKKKIGKAVEVVDATGQESDKKAAKYVIEEGKKYQKEKKKQEDIVMEDLTNKVKGPKIATYIHTLCKQAHDMVLSIGMPKEYQWGVWFDGKGIRLKVITPDKTTYNKAFKPTNDPKYDLFACNKLFWWAEDLYDGLEGNLIDSKPNGNIWVP